MSISDWSSDVCSSDLPLAHPDRGRVAAMLAAVAGLDPGPGLAPARRRDLDQVADALDIDADERVGRIDALVDIGRQEAYGIVAAHPERGLRQIVGPEREERGRIGDLARLQGGARQLDHRADEVIEAPVLLGEHPLGGRSEAPTSALKSLMST